MKILQIIIGLTLQLTMLHAQPPSKYPLKALKIGDTLIDFSIPDIQNYAYSNAKMSDFKGKYMILDFWGTECAPCIAAMPKLDSLQIKFKNDLQVLLVNNVPQSQIEKTWAIFSRLKRKHNTPELVKKFVSITGDTVLHQLFPHQSIPHYVWINRNGTVDAFTFSEEITAENIQNWISTGIVNVNKKEEWLDYDPNKTRLQNVLDRDPTLLKYYSSFTKYIKGGIGSNLGEHVFTENKENNTCKMLLVNRNLLSLYGFVFGASTNPYKTPKFDYGKRVAVITSDSSRFFYDTKNYKTRNDWMLDNLYTYEAVLPLMSIDTAIQQLKADLDRFFEIESYVEKRMVKCLALVRTSNQDKIAFKEKSNEKSPETGVWHDGSLTYTSTIDRFVSVFLAQNNQQYPLPFIDQTNYKDRVRLEITVPIDDIKQLRNLLQTKYDLDLIEKQAMVEVLVIRDKK